MMWNNDHRELEHRVNVLYEKIEVCNSRERALYVDKADALTKQREEFLNILKQINKANPYYGPLMMQTE